MQRWRRDWRWTCGLSRARQALNSASLGPVKGYSLLASSLLLSLLPYPLPPPFSSLSRCHTRANNDPVWWNIWYQSCGRNQHSMLATARGHLLGWCRMSVCYVSRRKKRRRENEKKEKKRRRETEERRWIEERETSLERRADTRMLSMVSHTQHVAEERREKKRVDKKWE